MGNMSEVKFMGRVEHVEWKTNHVFRKNHVLVTVKTGLYSATALLLP